MATCGKKEVSKGYVVPNPGLVAVAVAIDASKSYSVITVFNITDQHVKVAYQTEDGDAADFIVPANKHSFTRVLSNSVLLNNSLKVSALDNAATGKVIINLGN